MAKEILKGIQSEITASVLEIQQILWKYLNTFSFALMLVDT